MRHFFGTLGVGMSLGVAIANAPGFSTANRPGGAGRLADIWMNINVM
jgi:hypothetical protein